MSESHPQVGRALRGDTLIEVAIAIAIFCAVAAMSIGIMNGGLSSMQATMELTMARNEIDAQSEAIRFIHNNYLSEREYVKQGKTTAGDDRYQQYRNLWLKLTRNETETVGNAGKGLVNDPKTNPISPFYSTDCSQYYDKNNHDDAADANDVHYIGDDKAFVINTRNINAADLKGTIVNTQDSDNAKLFIQAPLYPRIVYTENRGDSGAAESSANDLKEDMDAGLYDQVASVEGIWVIGVAQAHSSSEKPEYYDFHIRTCWNAPGKNRPSTIATIFRLYNPEYVEKTL